MAELANADLSKNMVVGMATLADVERKCKELQDIQGRQETVLLINTGTYDSLALIWELMRQ